VQIRKSQLKGERPKCPVDLKHCVHRHGAYRRYGDCEEGEPSIEVLRYLCYLCGHTISVLPDGMLPYRPLRAELVEGHFDARAEGRSEAAEAPEKQSGCLKRAWRRFTRRLDALASVLGQIVQIRQADAKRIWRQLRRLGNLREILRFLAEKFKTSLLGDYRCLEPWAAPMSGG
jgi:hypothetical protein